MVLGSEEGIILFGWNSEFARKYIGSLDHVVYFFQRLNELSDFPEASYECYAIRGHSKLLRWPIFTKRGMTCDWKTT
jgi:acyl-CoA thioesterase